MRIVACLLAFLLIPTAVFAQQVTPLLSGSNSNAYADSLPDQIVTTSNIITPTTTQVLAPLAGTRIFLFWLGVQASVNNSSDVTFQFEYSPVAACASGATTLTPVVQSGIGLTTQNQFESTIASAITAAGSLPAFNPTPVPYVIPPNNYLCIVTAGTTIGVYAIALYAQHT